MAIFDDMSDADRKQVEQAGTSFTLPEGWSPFTQKTPADKAYIILDGTVSVRRDGQEIATLGKGDIFGESGIVHHKLRNATVVTTSPVKVLHLTRDQVERLSADLPSFKEALDRTAEERSGA